jgi:hypothetical protein
MIYCWEIFALVWEIIVQSQSEQFDGLLLGKFLISLLIQICSLLCSLRFHTSMIYSWEMFDSMRRITLRSQSVLRSSMNYCYDIFISGSGIYLRSQSVMHSLMIRWEVFGLVWETFVQSTSEQFDDSLLGNV